MVKSIVVLGFMVFFYIASFWFGLNETKDQKVIETLQFILIGLSTVGFYGIFASNRRDDISTKKKI